MGIEAGDRVAILLPQRLETGIAHLAIYKPLGIAVPPSGLFGPSALPFRLRDSGAKSETVVPNWSLPILRIAT